MAGYIDKGKITSIDGNSVRVVPCNESGLVSARVVVPWHLRDSSGNLAKGTEVMGATAIPVFVLSTMAIARMNRPTT